MSRILTRYDIQVNSEEKQMNLDFILNSDERKVIHGVVWDDNTSSPKRVPGALVQLFGAGDDYQNDSLDIYPIGHVITDASGEFLVGPFEKGTTIVFKIFKFTEDMNDDSEYIEISHQISGECSGDISGE